jgi:hypothetical protein
MTRKTNLIAGLMSAAVLATPALASASQISFGTRLDHEPSNSVPAHTCAEDGSDTPTPACTRVAIDQGDAVGGLLRAPKNGRIVAFKVRAGAPGQMTFRLVSLQGNIGPGMGTYMGRGDGTGPTVNVQGNGFSETGNPVETFKANLKVKQGDSVGIDSTSTSALYCSSGGAHQLIFSPTLGGPMSALASTSKTDGCELLVQAVMEPAKKAKKHKKHHKQHHHRRHH